MRTEAEIRRFLRGAEAMLNGCEPDATEHDIAMARASAQTLRWILGEVDFPDGELTDADIAQMESEAARRHPTAPRTR